MIYQSHVKVVLVLLFLVLGVVGFNQESQSATEPQDTTGSQSTTEPQDATKPQSVTEPQSLSLPMKAGLYELNITRTFKDKRDPLKVSRKRCLAEPNFLPLKSFQQSGNCKTTNISKGADKASFDIDCKNQEGTSAKASVVYSVVGEKLDWSIKFIDSEVIGTGKYIGECK